VTFVITGQSHLQGPGSSRNIGN